jgi:restriction system protein
MKTVRDNTKDRDFHSVRLSLVELQRAVEQRSSAPVSGTQLVAIDENVALASRALLFNVLDEIEWSGSLQPDLMAACCDTLRKAAQSVDSAAYGEAHQYRAGVLRRLNILERLANGDRVDAVLGEALTPNEQAVTSNRLLSENAPRIIIESLIIPGESTKEGMLIQGVSALWFEVLRWIKANPEHIYHLGCWKWEELLAGAYKQAGWEVVVLTPKRGDHGIDVIAERADWGQLRFLLLDQMKAYKPDHCIGPDEIRQMKGVLLDHPEASKGLITTTADFTPGAFDAARNLAPRLELRPRDKLVEWLTSLAIQETE